jgi:hypothetical protein
MLKRLLARLLFGRRLEERLDDLEARFVELEADVYFRRHRRN